MYQYIQCGSQKIKIRSIPGYKTIGAAKTGKGWRVVDLETNDVIGEMVETYGLLCEYAEANYFGQYE